MTRTEPAYRETIVGLTPAQPGWRALSVGWDDDTGGFMWLDDVAAWALVEDTRDGFRSVEGFVPGESGLESAESYRGQFLRYLSPGQTPEEFAAEIARRQQEEREERRTRSKKAPAGAAEPSANGHRSTPPGRPRP